MWLSPPRLQHTSDRLKHSIAYGALACKKLSSFSKSRKLLRASSILAIEQRISAMRLKWMIVGICCAGIPALLSQTDQGTKAGADWPMYNRDLASTRYSPLEQINTTNVDKLTQAWAYRLQPEGKTLTSSSAAEIFQEITPIV